MSREPHRPEHAGDRAAAMLRAALHRHRSGDLAGAERLYREILRQRPAHADALHYLGVIAHQSARHDEAEAFIRRAIESDGAQPFYHNNLGEVLRAKGASREASECYERALALAPDYADAHNNLGLCSMALGDAARALRAFARALEIDPSFSEARLNLGNACWTLGRREEAESAYAAVPPSDPHFAHARVALGSARLESGHIEESLAHFEAAARSRPGLAMAHIGRGDAHVAADRPDAALAAYRDALAADPRSADTHYRLGRTLRTQDRLEEALEALAEALRLRPDDGDALADLAELYEALERIDAVIETCRKAIEVRPGDALLHGRLGVALRTKGHGEEAIAVLREAVALDEGVPALHDALGTALQDQGQIDEARECFECALALADDRAPTHNNLGANWLVRGEPGRARACFERALELDPDYLPAIENLSTTRKFGEQDRALIDRLEQRLAHEKLADSSRESLHFTLGKIHDDCGDFARAFSHYRAGNRIHRRRIDYDPDAHEARVERLIAAFDEERVRRGLPGASPSELPVFIVGMPRSGTTLIEQILASHPEVHGAGELSYFARVEFRYRGGDGSLVRYADALDDLDETAVEPLTRGYLELLRKGAPSAHRVTDKMPTNFLHLGLIALAFPRARLIYCRRDAMDVGVSNFFLNFAFEASFSWDLYEIGRFYRQHERLMAHWQKVFPGRIHEVEYESLVRGQERVTRALLEHCGLEWDARCLHFHETRRHVLTASHQQVRQPLYSRSVGRWRRYEPFLDELRAGLADEPRPPIL